MAALASSASQLTCDDPLQSSLERFRSLFSHRDQDASLLAYAQGLLSGERRKSVERIVLRQLDNDPNQVCRLQYFATDSPWSNRLFPDATCRR